MPWELYDPENVVFFGGSDAGQTRWVYNFNGVDTFIDTGQRIVDVDNLNGFSFEGYIDNFGAGTILSQSDSATVSGREFQVFILDSMEVNLGGVRTAILSSSLFPPSGANLKLSFNTSDVSVFINEILINTVAYTIGAAREPATTTLIGARGDGTGGAAFFKSGVMRDFKFNGGSIYNYPINDRTFGAGAVIANTGTGPDATGVNLLESGWQEIPLPQTRWVYNFNGVDSYIDVGSVVYTGDYSRSIKFKMPTLSGNFVRLWGKDADFSSRFLISDDGSANIRFSDSDLVGVNLPAGTFVTDVTYNVTASRAGSAAKVTVNGVDFDFTGVNTDSSTFNFIQRMSSTSYGIGMVWGYTDSLGNNYPINDRTFGAGAVIANTGTGPDATGVNLLESGWQEINT